MIKLGSDHTYSFLYDSGLLHRLYGSLSPKITPRVYKIPLENLKYHSLLTLELTLYKYLLHSTFIISIQFNMAVAQWKSVLYEGL